MCSCVLQHKETELFYGCNGMFNIVEMMLQMNSGNPYEISEMDPSLRKQIQECNLQVVNVTAPANYFHVLRHQVYYFELPLK